MENLKEKEPDPEIIEAQTLSKSVFEILPEESYFPADHVFNQKDIEEFKDDIDDPIRAEVERVVDSLPLAEKVFIIQRLGLAHAIHNIPALMERGIDTYLAQIPPTEDRPDLAKGSYNFLRNAEVWFRNKDRVVAAKQKLSSNGKEKLKGISLSIDAHADYEDYEGKFDRFFPITEQLRELGITQITLLDETAPSNSPVQQARVDSPPKDWDKSHIFAQLRKYKKDGFQVSVFGVDVRF